MKIRVNVRKRKESQNWGDKEGIIRQEKQGRGEERGDIGECGRKGDMRELWRRDKEGRGKESRKQKRKGDNWGRQKRRNNRRMKEKLTKMKKNGKKEDNQVK